MRGILVKIVRICVYVVVTIIASLMLIWSLAAIWIDGPALSIFRILPSVILLLASGYSLMVLRPYWQALLSIFVLTGLVAVWWLMIPPSNERDWLPDVAKPATALVEDNLLTIHNVRNFNYLSETNFEPNWETRRYDLDKLRGVDIYFSYWGPTNIAHTILSWEFDNDRYLAVSIETRKEKGESYSAVKGFFRQFEVYYVVADERDVVRLRTNFRGEDLYLYRTTLTKEEAERLLLDYMNEINKLAENPRWYNALTHNCTTAVRYHAKHVMKAKPWNLHMVINGQLDQLLYERGQIDNRLPFAEMRRKSAVSSKAIKLDYDDFSKQLRIGLPGWKD